MALHVVWRHLEASPSGDGLCGPFQVQVPEGEVAIGGGGYLTSREASQPENDPAYSGLLVGRPFAGPAASVPGAPDYPDSWYVWFAVPGASGGVAAHAHVYALWEG